jgi:hypothetical protein
MPEMENRQKKTTVMILIGVVVVGAILLTLWIVGIGSIIKFLGYLAIILFGLAILGAMFYLIYELFFKKHKIDITYVNKKKLIEAGVRNKPDYLANLILSGDKGHTRVVWGKIIGYCRVQILTEVNETDEKGWQKYNQHPITKKMIPATEIVKEEQDVFITQKHGFPLSMFGEPDVVRVHPLDHDDLIGDVLLKGYSLLPISEYWFLHSQYLDVATIDKSILSEAKRGVFMLGLADMKEIVDRAINLDSAHTKSLEQKNLYDIPLPGQQQNPPAPPAA